MGGPRINQELQAAAAVEETLDALERLFDEAAKPGRQASSETRKRMRRKALELCAESGPDWAGVDTAVLRFGADSFCSIAVDLAAHPSETARLIEGIEATTRIGRAVLGYEVLRSPQLLLLPTAVAVEVQLDLLLAFAEVAAVSLWTLEAGGELKHMRYAGDLQLASKEIRRLARRMLTRAEPSIRTAGHAVLGVRIERWGQPAAILVLCGKPEGTDHRMALIEAVVPILSALLSRDEMLARLGGSAQEVVASVDRKLSRLRFDLHDGPQQDVALLVEDIRLFRAQLSSILDSGTVAERLLGHLDDVTAKLVALERDLRRISVSAQSPFLHPGSFPEALAEVADAFAARSGIDPQMTITGDFGDLTDSQQNGLLALIREALSNIRQHSDASEVSVTVAAGPDGVRAAVTDNGKGFEPETARMNAVRTGHLGLVGMTERIRLLGGGCHIDSQPGGPTIISVNLPAGLSQSPTRAPDVL